MPTRLALVSCKGPYEGVWANAKGNEVGLEIYMLGVGAFIRFEWMIGKSIGSHDFHSAGEHSLPVTKFEKYRIGKLGEPKQATIVRVQLNGQS